MATQSEGEKQSLYDFTATQIYLPPDETRDQLKAEEEARKDQQILDAENAQLQEDMVSSTIGLAIQGAFAFFILVSLFGIAIASYRWCKTKRPRSEKIQVIFQMILALIMNAAAIGIFYIELNTQLLLLMLLVSNISYNLSVFFALSMLKRDEKHMISSFARLRTSMLFLSFFQIIGMVASQSENELGATCSAEQSIPYVFSFMGGLQIIIYIHFLFEKLFGFGASASKKDEGGKDGKKDKKDKKQNKDAKSNQKQPEIIVLRQDQVEGEKLFREMNSFATRFTPLLLILKLSILLAGLLFVSESDWLKCDYTGRILYFTDEKGLAFIAAFAFQLILSAEMVRVTPYEGALGSKIFGEKPSSTLCASIMTCCAKVPDYSNFQITDEGQGQLDDSKVMTSAKKAKEALNKSSAKLNDKDNKILEESPGNDRTGLGEP